MAKVTDRAEIERQQQAAREAIRQIGKHEGHRQKMATFASSGRHVVISYPQDMSNEELLDFAGWILNNFRAQLPPEGLLIATNNAPAHD